MNSLLKAAAATGFLCLSLGFGPTANAEQSHYVSSNAVDKCQAFTPGVTNTIRNRVAGAENVGTQTIPVACTFELSETYGLGTATVDSVGMYFKNGSNAQMTVNCTLLPGDVTHEYGTMITKSVTLDPGTTGSVFYEDEGPWEYYGIGVNCNLPPQATIVYTVISYRNDF